MSSTDEAEILEVLPLAAYLASPDVLSFALDEGKALGTSVQGQLDLSGDLKAAHAYGKEEFAQARKTGQSVGRKRLVEVHSRVIAKLGKLVAKYEHGNLDEQEFRRQTTSLMKTAWREVYLAGLRAGGVPGTGPGAGKALVSLGEGDDRWLQTAMQHEMRYLNGFVRAVTAGDYVMPLVRRIRMYADTLSSFYESARVIALPAQTVIHWTGPDDSITCPGCRYLFEHSPYNKFNLPTTPRAGLTPCLSNCRDRLLVRTATPEEVARVIENADVTRETHVQRLRAIKRGEV